MNLRLLPLGLSCVLLAHPAGATLREWRAEGVVTQVIGTESLLPLPAEVGDEYVIEFSYDSEAVDENVLPNFGRYEILSLSVSIAGTTLDFIDGDGGSGRVAIQANTVDPNLWGVSACLGECDLSGFDEARVNFFFPANTILSDALTDPPDAAGAQIQFGQFSRDLPGIEEAFVVADLVSLTYVPEPGTAVLLLAGLVTLGSARGRQLRRR
jgi:hypothetical protein